MSEKDRFEDWKDAFLPRACATSSTFVEGERAAYCALRDTSEGRPAQVQQHEVIASSPVKVQVEAPDLIAAIRQIYGLGSAGRE